LPLSYLTEHYPEEEKLLEKLNEYKVTENNSIDWLRNEIRPSLIQSSCLKQMSFNSFPKVLLQVTINFFKNKLFYD
jgi:hypothetical protein